METETPLRMFETISKSKLGVYVSARTVHWLKEEMLKVQVLVKLRLCPFLWKDEFQFVT